MVGRSGRGGDSSSKAGVMTSGHASTLPLDNCTVGPPPQATGPVPLLFLAWLSLLSARLLQAEAERLLFEDPDPDTGFMMHPDLKWVGD